MTLPFDSEHDAGIELDSPTACQQELERCSNGLAILTQEEVRVSQALSEVEDQYERVEAIAARAIRDNSNTKLTATEVKAKITEYVTEDPVLSQIRESLFTLNAERESLARRMRTLEKRGGFAQSALNKHSDEARLQQYGEAGR